LVTASEEPGPRARAKRDQILTGARRVFLRDGFAGASTDAIAAEAGVSKRTLYAYYPSKEDLFVDVLRRLTIENPQSRVLATVEEMSPGSREELRRDLVELAQKMLGVMMQPDYLALLRIIIADVPRFPRLGGLFRSTVPERGFRAISALIGRAREGGIVRDDVDEEAATRMFAGSLVTYALLDGLFVVEGPPRPPAPDRIEKIVDLYMKAIA
jgi:TetR/AcrR family transcriptional repressor of mexJK operon